ncbi:sporulation control protein Spo0M [Vibrio sp. UCD-FRSSP16_10]|uniref:sporulation protein n=1 Tax=unclassified Vibrio TaxID=2614977 RepID=UPI0008009BFF|nr:MULTISPECIES: sporulation protein [unclassified Vibrio]OBT15645.1 sporulation control protein Spo0M [Vibrio sp. UCD-FRSSP16_30]OBT21055.1 sporulation control protein Spo0M [Vibrio sp. UCD-FRSSP16_10]
MSFFKKTLASLGIGSATVDAVLQQETLIPGDKVSVVIHVYGGATEQIIDHIDLKLCCLYMAEKEQRQPHSEGALRRKVPQNYVLDKWDLPYSFTIHPAQERTFEIELDVPLNTPLTIGDSKVWLETALDIDLAIDPTDKDMLTVRPDPVMDKIFTELEELGLRIRQVECEAAKGFAMPFVQEFEFVPTTGVFHGTWREVEIIAYRDDKQLQLWFEIDRQRKGLGGLLSNLLGSSDLNCYLPLSNDLTSEQAAKQVVDYLTDLFAAKQA